MTLLGYLQMSAMIERQNERNEMLDGEIAELDKQIEEINGLEDAEARG